MKYYMQEGKEKKILLLLNLVPQFHELQPNYSHWSVKMMLSRLTAFLAQCSLGFKKFQMFFCLDLQPFRVANYLKIPLYILMASFDALCYAWSHILRKAHISMLEPYGFNVLHSFNQVKIDDGLLSEAQCKWFNNLLVFHFSNQGYVLMYPMIKEFKAIFCFYLSKG